MKKIFLTFLIIFCIQGCASAPSYIGPPQVSLRDLCRQYNIECRWDSVSQSATLTRGSLSARVLGDSRLASVNGKRVVLSSPVRVRQGVVIVPPDFKTKIINRLAEHKVIIRPRFVKKVIIDAGHGGRDPGATGYSGVYEKDVVLNIARMLKNILESKGVQVAMTRSSDVYVSLEDRARFANCEQGDLFISIHANASPSHRIKGFEVYRLRNFDDEIQSEIKQIKAYQPLFDQLSMEKNSPVLNNILLDMAYNYKRAESLKLAEAVAQQTARDLKLTNRGCKSAGFFVLKHTLIPSVLVEVGFLSNKEEESLLKQTAYQKKIAESLAESILDYAQEQ